MTRGPGWLGSVGLLVWGCGPTTPEQHTVALGLREPDAIELSLAAARTMPRWDKVSLRRKGELWVGDLPYREGLNRLFTRQPPGLFLERGLTTSLPYGLDGEGWWVDDRTLYIRPGKDMVVPEAIMVRYLPAFAAARHREPDGTVEPWEFVRRRMPSGDSSLEGLFLPAPSSVSWNVEVPARGRFHAEIGAIPAVLEHEEGGGVELRVEVVADDNRRVPARCLLEEGSWCTVDADLSAFEGQRVELTLRSVASGPIRHVLVHAPRLYTPRENARRVVMLYADTFRFDRLGVFGAEHPTPNLDGWATGAARFTQARSVASWTVPSIRAVRSGRQPEEWDEAVRLAEVFREAGWYTAGFASNAFTASHEDMGRGFERYRYRLKSPASRQVDEAIAVLERYPDQEVFLSVQFMDTHLPYEEPEPFLSMFTEPSTSRMPNNRGPITRSRDPRLKPYVQARYDQNVQFIDHEVGRLLAHLGPDDIVVFFSDHGEELWEHGGFEHGHALWDEVARVPLVVSAPGVAPRQIDTPVSLLDIAPTLLDLVGLPALPEADGVSLVPLLNGDRALDRELRGRDQLIGRTLWDADAWGLVRDQEKLVAQWGRFDRFDLAADPGEQQPTPLDGEAAAQARTRLEAQHGHPFVEAIAVRSENRRLPFAGRIQIRIDGEVSGAWTGYRTPKLNPGIEQGQVTFSSGTGLPGQVYLLPSSGIDGVGRLELEVQPRGGKATTAVWEAGSGPLELELEAGGQRFQVMVDTVPAPGNVEIPVAAAGLEDQLEALGYAE